MILPRRLGGYSRDWVRGEMRAGEIYLASKLCARPQRRAFLHVNGRCNTWYLRIGPSVA